ncbi:MAG: hypothetical protein AVO34_07645 [Firmicutes bacterium ML8_F2]|nr:MAG: hypothetical protein AVO34_07645 [Firmicutes bacterium ML8_F2]
MKKDEYLSKNEVGSFIEWLIPRLDQENLFQHSYVDRRSGITWQCNSVYDAYKKYRWGFSFIDENGITQTGTTYADNELALNKLRNKLREAYLNQDAEALCNISCIVLEWGKVSNWNSNWCKTKRDKLFQLYGKGMSMLKPAIADDSGPFPERFNSGMTKIYSLLLNDFIIYDGRVGAALGYLVICYCRRCRFTSVPPLIKFPWAPGKETNSANPKNRDPSSGNLLIEPISGSAEHARWNLRASWLLKEAASRSKKFSNLAEPLRAIEAGLFMIGYDLGDQNKMQAQSPGKNRFAAQKEEYPYITLGKGYKFRVDYDPGKESLTFSYPMKKNGKIRAADHFSLHEIQRVIVYLKEQFAGHPFPLANNVERLNKYTENNGLGMAIRTLPQTVAKAQAASYLGPYLERVGVFKLIVPRPARWRLVVDPEDVTELIKEYHEQ